MKTNAICFMLLAGSSVSAVACDPETGERRQMIFLESGGKTVEYWQMDSGRMREVNLPSGEKIGVSITPASVQKYQENGSSGRFSPELVEIRLYDLSAEEPMETHMSWRGANSVQGFSNFTLNLLKPVCYQPEVKSVGG